MGNKQAKEEEKPLVGGGPDESRKRIVQEILSTEEAYVRSLAVINDIYIQPLLQQKILSEDNVKTIFGNWGELLQFHRDTLLPQILNRVGAWEKNTKIGDVFLKLLESLKMYSFYVNNYNDGLLVLSRQQGKKKNFDKFLQKAKENTASRGLDVLSYLIMPVQRLPRYVLLLNELKKNTSNKHPDYKNIDRAVSGLGEVAAYVNEQKRISENLQELLVLQASFSGKFDEEICQEHRLIISTGEVKAGSDKAFWWLFCDRILIGTPSAMGKVLGAFGSKEQYSKVVFAPLWDVEVIVNPNKATGLSLEVKGAKPVTLTFGNGKLRDDWAQAVLAAKTRSFQFRDPKGKSNTKQSFSFFSSSSSSSSSVEIEANESNQPPKSSRCCCC